MSPHRFRPCASGDKPFKCWHYDVTETGVEWCEYPFAHPMHEGTT